MPDIESHLLKLHLRLTDIENLSPNEQRKKIREQWLILSLCYHPDKNPHNPEIATCFQEITDTYNTLNTGLGVELDKYRQDICTYFSQENIVIPETAFDFLLQENIEQAYRELLKKFATLQEEQSKAAFVLRYASFINLAESLEKDKNRLNLQRVHHLYASPINQTLIQYLTHEWRQLIIRLFGEEYLDDFQYRNALAFGDLLPVLATRKLLSPIKLMVALLNSLTMLIYLPIFYLPKYLIKKVSTDCRRQVDAYKQGTLSIQESGIIFLKVVGLIGIISAPFYFAATLTLFVLSLPMASNLLEFIASPINQLIRPLSAYTGISVIWLTPLSAIIGTVMTHALINALSLAGLTFSLQCLIIPLFYYSLYSVGKLFFNFYKLDPLFAFFQIPFFIVFSLILRQACDPSILHNALGLFLAYFTNFTSLYYVNKFLGKVHADMDTEYEVLPLPQQNIPESIQRATLLGNKKAAQSHRFFNTPKEAEYLEPNERTFWQKANSFFGAGSKQRDDILQEAAPEHKYTTSPAVVE